jgi:ADP-ribosylglycohydrolase
MSPEARGQGRAADVESNAVDRMSPAERFNEESGSNTGTEKELESEPGPASAAGDDQSASTPSSRHRAVTSSALWAAYADAHGFITELASEKDVKRRAGGLPDQPVKWKRRVGGRGGPTATLPAGCYSDDTQLRLCVSRAMSGSGFDIEAFARVELPLWPAYALGGGNASKKAATAFTRANMDWYANFYDGWSQAGGNGAAMRIQPHMWAASDPASIGPSDVNVVLDAITTHGHPRAIFGAVLHARSIAFALVAGRLAGPLDWPNLVAQARAVLDLLHGHHPWDTVWRPRWEDVEGKRFAQAWFTVADECAEALAVASEIDMAGHATPAERYAQFVAKLSLDDPAQRGSGTLSAVAALALSWWTTGEPAMTSLISAHQLGTDTDTVGTMAAALTGLTAGDLPDRSRVLDYDYLVWDAQRLADIACGRNAEQFRYPDLLGWLAPKTQADCFGIAAGRPALAGLAWCTVDEDTSYSVGQMRWNWVSTDFGQSLLVKSRVELPDLAEPLWPVSQDPTPSDDRSGGVAAQEESRPGTAGPRVGERKPSADSSDDAMLPVEVVAKPSSPAVHESSADNVARMFDWVARQGFAPGAIGYAHTRLAEVGSLEQTIAFAVLVHEHLTRKGR